MRLKREWKRVLALAAAAVCLATVTGCNFINLGDNSSNSSSESSSEGRGPYKPIILKNVEKAKNLILLIGDGMGPNQIMAGSLFRGEDLCMMGFPYHTKVNTDSLSGLTDSAAAGTALATGTRTINGYVGKDEYLVDLTTIVDIAASMGKRTGIITTEEIYGATPMSFMGHSDSRGKTLELINSVADDAKVNLLMSYIYSNSYTKIFTKAGYEFIESVDYISEATSDKIVGNYLIRAVAPSMTAGEVMGNIAFDRLVSEALDYLSKDEDGFFLMAEGAHIDHGGHNNDMTYMLQELLAFDDGVRAVLEWAKDRDDTVVIVTADHETGGLQLKEGITGENILDIGSTDGGMTYEPLYYEWTTTSHSSQEVYCFINGANIDFSQYTYGTEDKIANTDVFKIMKKLLEG